MVGEGTKVGRFLYQSKEDLRMWMIPMHPTTDLNFLDAISIFYFLDQPHLDSHENMSQLYNSEMNGFYMTYESCIISSMQNLLPNLFGNNASDGVDTSQALPVLQSMDKWNNNGVTGLLLQVECELSNVDMHFQNVFSTTFDDYP